jgi:hypothetical protein
LDMVLVVDVPLPGLSPLVRPFSSHAQRRRPAGTRSRS